MPPRLDAGRTFALAWLVSAIGVTLVVGPSLGLRGWLWLGLHDVLCAVGAGHELWRKRTPPNG